MKKGKIRYSIEKKKLCCATEFVRFLLLFLFSLIFSQIWFAFWVRRAILLQYMRYEISRLSNVLFLPKIIFCSLAHHVYLSLSCSSAKLNIWNEHTKTTWTNRKKEKLLKWNSRFKFNVTTENVYAQMQLKQKQNDYDFSHFFFCKNIKILERMNKIFLKWIIKKTWSKHS